MAAPTRNEVCYYCDESIEDFPMLLKPGVHAHEYCYCQAIDFLRRMKCALEVGEWLHKEKERTA